MRHGGTIIGIVGKYGAQVQAPSEGSWQGWIFRTICPLHGPVLTENLGHYHRSVPIPGPPTTAGRARGSLIAYTSVYGHTKTGRGAAGRASSDSKRMSEGSAVTDLARGDMSQALERRLPLRQARSRHHHLQRKHIFPFMNEFIHHV